MSTITPLKILKSLITGYLGTKTMMSELIVNDGGYVAYMYNKEGGIVLKARLEKEGEAEYSTPLMRINDNIYDILYSKYGNERYTIILGNSEKIDGLYLCRYIMCDKYNITPIKISQLDNMNDGTNQENIDEHAEIVSSNNIKGEMGENVKLIHWHLLMMKFNSYSEDMINKDDIGYLALTGLKYMFSIIEENMVLVKTKNMTPYLVRHSLIRMRPLIEFNDGSELYLAPKKAYLLGEYTAMKIEPDPNYITRVSLQRITMHQVLEEIAKRRLG